MSAFLFSGLCKSVFERWQDIILHYDILVFKLINTGLACLVLDYIMYGVTVAGGGTGQVLICFAFLIYGLKTKVRNYKLAGYSGLVSVVISTVVVQICKHIWARPRPLLSLYDVRVVGVPLFGMSFPSGHTMTALAVAVACSIYVPRFRKFLIPFAVLTGISRVYVGAHFPVDVLFGGIVGSLIGISGASIVRKRNGKV